MKKTLITTTLITVIAVMVNAQTRTELKGPAAKNYKVWEDTSAPTPVYFSADAKLAGPEAKNVAVWQQDNENKILVVSKKREKMLGPEAKNFKPWENRNSGSSAETDAPLLAKAR